MNIETGQPMLISFMWNLLKLMPCRVWIITSHFANCKEVNSSYCDCKVVNHTKNEKQFFPKENLIHLDHTLPHYMHHSSIVLLAAEILLILKITSHAKNALQFLKKNFRLQQAKPYYAQHIYCEVNFRG